MTRNNGVKMVIEDGWNSIEATTIRECREKVQNLSYIAYDSYVNTEYIMYCNIVNRIQDPIEYFVLQCK